MNIRLKKEVERVLITYKVTEKTGKIVGARIVKDDDELMLINTSGVAIRINVADISVTSRNTMGVTLMRTNDEEKVVAIAKIPATEKIENEQLEISEDIIDIENISEIIETNELEQDSTVIDNSLEKLLERAEETEE